jgi:GNAT superfamily N-acetyltransferase
MATPASTIQDRIKLHHWEIIRFDIGAKYNPLEELICPMPSRDLAAPVAFAKSSNSKPAPMATTRTGSIADRMVFREVTSDNWPDFEGLFECKGGPKACWCMVWRATPAEAKRTDGTSPKAAMKARITAGTAVGLLGYLEKEPVAWCSVAPRSTYRRLVEEGGEDKDIWSIVCFFVVRRLRGQRISRRLIAAAVEFAKGRGASIVEAYPVDPSSPSYRFMGFIPMFAAAGFRETGQA